MLLWEVALLQMFTAEYHLDSSFGDHVTKFLLCSTVAVFRLGAKGSQKIL